MIHWFAIATLVAGQCADLYADWLSIRNQPTKQWQQIILKTSLLKAATWLPVAAAVWWMGTAGAFVAGAQGMCFAIYKIRIK